MRQSSAKFISEKLVVCLGDLLIKIQLSSAVRAIHIILTPTINAITVIAMMARCSSNLCLLLKIHQTNWTSLHLFFIIRLFLFWHQSLWSKLTIFDSVFCDRHINIQTSNISHTVAIIKMIRIKPLSPLPVKIIKMYRIHADRF